MHAFRRQFIYLVASPRRYREAIIDYDRAHPQSPFTPQGGPTYTLHRARLDPSRAANLSVQDIINVFLDNRIPPEWADHAYVYGVIGLNGLYNGSPINQGLLDTLDNERLARLHIYGEPIAIPAWDGRRHPTPNEVQTLHDIMDQEDLRNARRDPRDVPEHVRGLESPAWLLAGQTGVVEYLTGRPQGVATQYTLDHPVTLPYYAELDSASALTTATAAAPVGGNPPMGPATMDVDVAVNADTVTSSDAPQCSPDITLAPLTLGGPTETTEAPSNLPPTA